MHLGPVRPSAKTIVLAWFALLAIVLIGASPAAAHCFAGARFFPAMLITDDPCVADELSLPTISSFKTGDIPANRQLDISAEFSKRITEDFGVSVSPTYTRLWVPGGPVHTDGRT